MIRWRGKMQGLVDNLFAERSSTRGREIEEEIMVKRAIEKARRELLTARSNFDSVSDEDMVDHAIYSLQAAEKKYAYLLKYARERGYRQAVLEKRNHREEF